MKSGSNGENSITSNQHAYIVVGTEGVSMDYLESELSRALSFETKGNSDFRSFTFESFGIDETRMLKSVEIERPVSGDKKIFVLSIGSFTREAQNALLKVLEDPTGESYFFFIVPSGRGIIPTLRSRVRVIKLPDSSFEAYIKEAEELLRTPRAERLNLPVVKKLVEGKERAGTTSFLNALESVLLKKLDAAGRAEHASFFDALFKFKSYISDRSPSLKMLLEEIALIAPEVA